MNKNRQFTLLYIAAMVFLMGCGSPMMQIMGTDWGWSSPEQGLKYVRWQNASVGTEDSLLFVTDIIGRSSDFYQQSGKPEALWHSEAQFYVTHGNKAQGVNGHDVIDLSGHTVQFRVFVPPEVTRRGDQFVLRGLVKDSKACNALTDYYTLPVSSVGYFHIMSVSLDGHETDECFDARSVDAVAFRLETVEGSRLEKSTVGLYLMDVTVK